jgi:hypothetical protein
MKSRYPRSLSIVALTFFLTVGTYNAVVINSESTIDTANVKFVKRLDELYGVTEPGRLVANSHPWQKIPAPQKVEIKPKIIVQEVRTIMAAETNREEPEAPVTAAAVQEDLSLNLVEVVNPKKWQQGLNPNQFAGTLSTANGTIENLNVSLPNGEGVSISFSEMTGNVFEYDLNGEIYSGMMYQVDQSSYMISLTNGPLEGTRLKFMGENQEQKEAQEAEAIASQGMNFGTDSYGNNSESSELANNQVEQTEIQPNDPNMQAQEARPSELQPAEVPAMDQQQPVDVAYQQQFAQDASSADLQFQQEAQNFEQPQIN